DIHTHRHQYADKDAYFNTDIHTYGYKYADKYTHSHQYADTNKYAYQYPHDLNMHNTFPGKSKTMDVWKFSEWSWMLST
ncbi:hypothetical protein EBT16_04235, partial [bacterium]|nr:hypothetical protein [bacterium]